MSVRCRRGGGVGLEYLAINGPPFGLYVFKMPAEAIWDRYMGVSMGYILSAEFQRDTYTR